MKKHQDLTAQEILEIERGLGDVGRKFNPFHLVPSSIDLGGMSGPMPVGVGVLQVILPAHHPGTAPTNLFPSWGSEKY